jgi:hypothetical protein
MVLHSQIPGYLKLQDDLALKATATSSSGIAAAAIDGVVDGYPGDSTKEWSTRNEKEGAWITLTWAQPVEVNAIYLYDRPNVEDNILAGVLEFDDGTQINVDALPGDGASPLKVTFPTKNIHWVKFSVTKVSPKTRNVGLSEIAVFRD